MDDSCRASTTRCEQTDKALPESLQPALVELHYAFADGDVYH